MLTKTFNFIASQQPMVIAVWIGLIVLAIIVTVLLRTRWAQSRPLHKCAALSLLAHLFLVGYAMTVQIASFGEVEYAEEVFTVTLVDDGPDEIEHVEMDRPKPEPPQPSPEPTVPPVEPPVEPPEGLPNLLAAEEQPPVEPAVEPAVDAVSPAEPDDTPIERMHEPSVAPLHHRYASGAEEELFPLPDKPAEIGPPVAAMARRDADEHSLPELYRMRVAPDRSQLARRFGATLETEAAVKSALKWLASAQQADGRWHAADYGGGSERTVAGRDRGRAGAKADSGITGLALLAFMAAGHTHREGEYQEQVRRGLEYLIEIQAKDGNLAGDASTFAAMYCHAMAAFAMSEAYGMTGDPALREPVSQAIAYTVAAQDPRGGGFRYRPGDPGDTSQLGWQLMALKSADLAGIPIPEKTRRGMLRFLDSVSVGRSGGLASYRPREKVTRPMTAEALACRLFLGMKGDDPKAEQACDYLLGELPGAGRTNLYYWYYATLSMHQIQGESWRRWNNSLQKALLRSQQSEGEFAGSWEPSTEWGGYGGRVYSTALATLCLEVYYRFLPLYDEVEEDI